MKTPVLTDRLHLSSGSRVITEKDGAATQFNDSGIKGPAIGSSRSTGYSIRAPILTDTIYSGPS
jgi:hypothetical protein